MSEGKKEERVDDILVTSELVESHILTGSFPVSRDNSWAESRSRGVDEGGQVALIQIPRRFCRFSKELSHATTWWTTVKRQLITG